MARRCDYLVFYAGELLRVRVLDDPLEVRVETPGAVLALVATDECAAVETLIRSWWDACGDEANGVANGIVEAASAVLREGLVVAERCEEHG